MELPPPDALGAGAAALGSALLRRSAAVGALFAALVFAGQRLRWSRRRTLPQMIQAAFAGLFFATLFALVACLAVGSGWIRPDRLGLRDLREEGAPRGAGAASPSPEASHGGAAPGGAPPRSPAGASAAEPRPR